MKHKVHDNILGGNDVRNVSIKGTFYLNGGAIIEDKIILDEEKCEEEVQVYLNEMREQIKFGLKEEIQFQFTFGNTMIRGSEIAAVKLEKEVDET